MAVRVQSTCSECDHKSEMDLQADLEELRCPDCGHTVPMFPAEDFDELEAEQQKRTVYGYIAMVAASVMLGAFIWYTSLMEAYALIGDGTEEGGEEPGAWLAISVIFMGVSFLVLMFFGCKAAARKVNCEY